ncbi:hypothetical protein MRB53_028238 [Persea americana]|uniref:Uncharacterized protein n=1 Tax=Persea americana TaxID=3435 RepID=A0ACC2KFH8_PERAE|nr:hypothetical protein MRB53_028238 [Persea americana]|eukprot:TRINITY_DN34561_c0_g1_i1.p1 TRINITY_DN34561_c0_g1~~TRINITY_DN34561_c0_g1_i1.p1  ORF type:complete len:279 (+),score=84.38 TRINITY_DN34561_c0_g1_i1:101-937(+)
MGSTSNNGNSSDSYDLSFKILFIGDAGVGKSSLISSFVSNSEQKENLPSTIGVDFRIKPFTVGGKTLKLTIWDTAGQEKLRTLKPLYYRGAHGIILVYDVTRRETFTNMTNIWSKEIQQHSTNQNCIKVLVGNKVDKESERVVTKEEGTTLAKENGFIYFECSARTRENVEKCFEELALKILVDHVLLEEGSKDVKKANEKSGADPVQGSKDVKNANEKSGVDPVLLDEGSKDVKNANEKSGVDPVQQDEGPKEVKNASEKSSSGGGGSGGDGGCGVM